MSRLFQLLSFEDITKIIDLNLSTFIDEHQNDNFYNSIDDSDVQFLKGVTSIKEFTSIDKMKIFHNALKFIGLIIFTEHLDRKGVYLSISEKNELSQNWDVLSNADTYSQIKQKLSTLTDEELTISLKFFYTDIINLVERKKTGTEFTPEDIVRFMFDSIDYSGKKILTNRLLEPACGSGIFISEALKRIISVANNTNEDIIGLLIDRKVIEGIDINPINVFISKLVLITDIIQAKNQCKGSDILYLFKYLPIRVSNALEENIENYYDYVIGNPPYIRLQNLPVSQREFIKDNFVSATGRFDLYVCFIEKAIKFLKVDGKISFITSNKFLTANYGKGIRKYLKDNLEIDLLFDLCDTKFFDASVLPSIIVGRKVFNPMNNQFSYFHIKQDNSDSNSYKSVDIFNEILKYRNSKNEIKDYFLIENSKSQINIEFVYSVEKLPVKEQQWNFGSKGDTTLKEYIERQTVKQLSEIADVCVGIKTTADEVFVKPMTKNFIIERMFESQLVYPLIQSDNVERWNITWESYNINHKYILYPHKVQDGRMVAEDLDLYPNIRNYIYENEERLKSRSYLMESNSRQWYECWVPQHLSKFQQPKIVTRDIVSSNSFAIDLEGRLCQGNTFFLTLKENQLHNTRFSNIEYLKYLLAILNSEVMEFYHKSISGSLYSKKFRYTTTNLNRWLVPIINEANSNRVSRIIDIVDEIQRIKKVNMTDREKNENITSLEEELNKVVYNLYNISDDSITNIKEFLKTNS